VSLALKCKGKCCKGAGLKVLSPCGLGGIPEQATKAPHQASTHKHLANVVKGIAEGFIEW
jgi:hypothetical protein